MLSPVYFLFYNIIYGFEKTPLQISICHDFPAGTLAIRHGIRWPGLSRQKTVFFKVQISPARQPVKTTGHEMSSIALFEEAVL
jgi:hypothetical protein